MLPSAFEASYRGYSQGILNYSENGTFPKKCILPSETCGGIFFFFYSKSNQNMSENRDAGILQFKVPG